MIFKNGVEPKWEDPANQVGGSFILEYLLQPDTSQDDIDCLWRRIVFSIVGNSFPYADQVTGFRFMDRIKKFNTLKIELWTTFSVKNGDKTADGLIRREKKEKCS